MTCGVLLLWRVVGVLVTRGQGGRERVGGTVTPQLEPEHLPYQALLSGPSLVSLYLVFKEELFSE